MDYMSALHRLLGLVDHERITSPDRERVRYDLRRMEALLRRLGDPHTGRPTVHIAGTKGKGSTSAMCASVLSRQGYRTGLYISPHLHTFRERICLDGTPVSEEEFAALVEEIWPELEWVSGHGDYGEVTMFEALTAMAFCHFRKRADFQVLEVGLGGRLDTTNLVSPQVCAITSLSLDHTSILGDTIESIATEKAGIIKPGATVVASPQAPEPMGVIESVCREKGAHLIKVGEHITWRGGDRGTDGQGLEVQGRLGSYELWMPLLGDYQLENAATAVGVLEALKQQGHDISGPAIEEGFRQVRWPCRMEVLEKSPLVVCDGAHNPYSAARLRDSLPAYFKYRQVVLIVGISQDKNLEGIVGELAPLGDRIIVTRSRHPRAAPTGVVARAFASRGLEVSEVEDVGMALGRALEEAHEDHMVLVTGSLFVAAEAREAIKGIEPELYPELQTDSYPLPR
jgi:dihydrofolate synthase/folylpolyglutamate synthase